jgi:hypothetical protein
MTENVCLALSVRYSQDHWLAFGPQSVGNHCFVATRLAPWRIIYGERPLDCASSIEPSEYDLDGKLRNLAKRLGLLTTRGL